MREIAFTPAQADAVTAVSPAQQRDWRRHGYIAPIGRGWAKYDALRLSELFLVTTLKTLTSLEQAARVAEKLGPLVAAYVRSVAVDGATPAKLTTCVALRSDGSIGVYPTPSDALDYMSEKQEFSMHIYAMTYLVPPFALRVRDQMASAGQVKE